MRKQVVGDMMASMEDKRRNTITNLHDLTKQLDKLHNKTKNKKFRKYLKDLKEQSAFSVNSNKVISKKDLKKVYKLLDKIYKHLHHQVWNHGKIKRKLKKINRLLGIVLDY